MRRTQDASPHHPDPMPLQLHLIPLAGFAGLMATAAFEDFRRLVIPNGLILGLCVLWPLHFAAAPALTPSAGLAAIGCAAAVFGAGALLFARGLIGGGDVKLVAAAALWAGPGAMAALFVLTGLFGGLLCLLLLTPLGALLTPARRTASGPAAATANIASPVPVPYGVAIAAAALVVTIPPNFSWS
jgi:prepilin peptidase CpaA